MNKARGKEVNATIIDEKGGIDNYTQLCVWPATALKEGDEPALVNFFKEKMNTRIKFAQVALTLPDKHMGEPVPDTGNRSDVLFWVHSDDIMKFAMPRLSMGIRWWEDVLDNEVQRNGHVAIYPKELLEKYPYTWTKEEGVAV